MNHHPVLHADAGPWHYKIESSMVFGSGTSSNGQWVRSHRITLVALNWPSFSSSQQQVEVLIMVGSQWSLFRTDASRPDGHHAMQVVHAVPSECLSGFH